MSRLNGTTMTSPDLLVIRHVPLIARTACKQAPLKRSGWGDSVGCTEHFPWA
jgi:hypothetical protein